MVADPPFVPIGNKLVFAGVLVLAVATVGIFAGLSQYEREKMISAKEQAGRKAGDLFLRAVATPVLFDDATGIKDTVALLTRDPEVQAVTLWRPSDGGAPPRPELLGQSERHPDHLILRDAVRDPDGKVIAVATVRYSLARENQAYRALRQRILLSAAGMALLLSLVLWAMTRHLLSRPLSRLLSAVKQLEAGTARAAPQDVGRANDEVGRLAAAFSRMADAVARREQDVLQRNADMKLIMDNVAQGFLTVTRDGALLPEHSAILETWFGPWTPGQPFWTYLARSAPREQEGLEVLWENVRLDFLPMEVSLEQLPARLTDGERVFALSFRPIRGSNDENILVMVSEITLEVAQERAKIEQQEMIALFQWMVRDPDGLRQFFDDAQRLVEAVTGPRPDGDFQDFQTLAREVHTLKGNSGMFGQLGLVQACQETENHFAEGERILSSGDRDAILLAWHKLSDRRRLLLGEARQPELTLSTSEYQRLLDDIARGAPRADLLQRVRSFKMEPVWKRLGRLAEQARSLARRLEKGDITVSIEAEDVRLPERPFEEFWGTFTHVLRNAIDHGLETPAERQAAGKAAAGHLTLRAVARDGHLAIELADDGRGINWEAVQKKAAARGLLATTHEELEIALFTDGISTRDAVTEVSGRGVGLGAVRSACERSGGRVRVISQPGLGTCFQFIWDLGHEQKRSIHE